MAAEFIGVPQDDQLADDLAVILSHAKRWQITRTVGKPTAIKHAASVVADLYRHGYDPATALAALEAAKTRKVDRCDTLKAEFERQEQAARREATLLETIKETLPMLHGETRLAAQDLRRILES